MPHPCIRSIFALFAIGAATTITACADQEASAGADRDQGAEAARLVVYERLPDLPRYREGSRSFLRLERVSDGSVVVDEARTDGREARGSEPLLDRAVTPGTYRLLSYQRPCQATCEALDNPTDHCETQVSLREGATTVTRVELLPRGGCVIRPGSPE